MKVGIESFNDMEAEESLIGAMLLRRESALEAIDLVEASDFYFPLNGRIFSAIESLIGKGTAIDYVTVASEAGDSGLVEVLSKLQNNTPSSRNVSAYAVIVHDKSMTRQLYGELEDLQSSLKLGSDPYEVASSLDRVVSDVGSPIGDAPQSMTIEELNASISDIADVVIPGLLERDWRTILVAPEGMGKSTLMRAIAMTSAQGIHPFTHNHMKPIRVLIVDLENPKKAIVTTGMKLVGHLKSVLLDDYDPERLRIYRQPQGIDLRKIRDRSNLQREIAFHRPDLVCIGPVIKMYQKKGGESYEDSADAAMHELDELRIKYGFALLLEHHAAKGHQGQRELTPFGSQRWMSWPDAGKSLTPDKEDPTILRVSTFRGDRMDSILWPDSIVRDRDWLVRGRWDKDVPSVLRESHQYSLEEFE